MGRQKQNEPRRERPQVPHHQLTAEQAAEQLTAIAQAEEIELPPIVSSGQKGTVLDVASVGVDGDGLLTGRGTAYVRLTDDTYRRLPESLRGWAEMILSTVLSVGQEGNPFPAKVDFGTINGRPYAEVL